MSKIEWTDRTLNPGLYGCSKVSPACTNCYAMGTAQGLEWKGQEAYKGVTKGGQWTGEVRVAPIGDAVEKIRRLPVPRDRSRRRRVFVTSMSDVLHEDVPIEWTARLIVAMGERPDHTFQVLTKRAHRLPELAEMVCAYMPDGNWPENVWVGVTVEDQKRADERVPLLLKVPAAVRFLSVEPLLGPVSLGHVYMYGGGAAISVNPLTGHRNNGQGMRALVGGPGRYPSIDWVIVGGESGPNARPMHPDWARSIRDQCVAAGVPFFMKQMSGRSRAALKDMPEDLMIREFPNG